MAASGGNILNKSMQQNSQLGLTVFRYLCLISLTAVTSYKINDFEEFSSKGFKMRLNISNPLLVSQSDLGKDNLILTFIVPELFQSKKTMQILE